MRVGLFTESYDPILNGVSTSVKTLATELLAAGHTPIVVAPEFPGTMIAGPHLTQFYDDEDCGFEVIRLPAWRTIFNPENPFGFPPIGVIPQVLRDLPLDIVHTQQPFGIGMHGRSMAYRLGIPLISTFHTLYTEYTHYFKVVPHAVAYRFLTTVMRSYYGSCTAVVVPSREAGRHLERLDVSAGRLHVIPTGVPEAPVVLPSAIEKTRKTFSLPSRAPVLLFVGRIAHEKNLELLIEAFASLCRMPPYATANGKTHPVLLLVGAGPALEICREHIERLDLQKWVRSPGSLKREELAPVYAAATVFCFPSPTETQGVVLSEAQSHGLPCVVVEGGGAPEFVRPGIDALLVPNQPEAFAEAIRSFLEDEPRRRAFAAAALQSPLRPTPRLMAEQTIDLYQKVLAAPPRPKIWIHRSAAGYPALKGRS